MLEAYEILIEPLKQLNRWLLIGLCQPPQGGCMKPESVATSIQFLGSLGVLIRIKKTVFLVSPSQRVCLVNNAHGLL